MRHRILFVDDEPPILSLLDAATEPMRNEWDVRFAESGQAALAEMKKNPFDVVVSDMRMPGMDGITLLHEVYKMSPRSVRIILSGYADKEQVRGAIASVHQFMMKPFDLDALLNVLTRVGELNRWLMDDTLRTTVARMSNLPSLPKLYYRIMDALQSPTSTIHDIGKIISTDPALTAKLLQLVNSAFFGAPRPVSTASEAIQILGVDTIRSLVLASHVFSAFDTVRFKELPVEEIWAHSMQTGRLAQQIARRESHDPVVVDVAFTAGCLHDIGKLIFIANMPAQYRDVLHRASLDSIPLTEIERPALGASHAEVGAYLLGVWGLPSAMVEAVAIHHEPSQSSSTVFNPLAAVHIADAMVHATSTNRQGEDACRLAADYVQRFGLPTRLEEWLTRLSE